MSYGMFENNLFDDDGLGDLPQSAAPIRALASYRARFPTLPSDAMLASKRATHFTTRVVSGIQQEFSFYTESGELVNSLVYTAAGATLPVEPSPVKDSGVPARQEGDGLLPSMDSQVQMQVSAPLWMPIAFIGGAILVGGGILWMASKRMRANRRRSRRRRYGVRA